MTTGPTHATETAADLHSRWDAITIADLRAQGSMKWTAHEGALGMWLAEMDFGIAEPVRAAITPAIAAGALGYLPPHERDILREATAAHQRDAHGWHIQPRDVVLLPDVMSGLSAVLTHLTAPGTPVVVPTPAYMPFLTWPASHGRDLVQVPSSLGADGRHHLDLAAIDETLARSGPGALVVLCNPWNPVGRVLERAELLALADVIEAREARVFSDEIHAPLVLEGTHLPYASLDERTAAHTTTGVSASKGWNIPGLKCGQLVLSNDTDRARLDPFTPRLGDSVGLLGARAATAAYREGGPWIAAARDYLRANRDLLATAIARGDLPGVRAHPIEGSYIAWLDFSQTPFAAGGALDADALREASGVALTDGALCGAADHARMILATPRPILTEAIERLSAALRGK